MFTGLIRTTATLRLLGHNLAQVVCTGHLPELILEGLELGDSVAVDGICLTVTEIQSRGFVATVSPETVSRTTLNGQVGEVCVNLEPALKVGSKLGGHFVTGHIDGVGYLEASVQTENAWEMSFQVGDAKVARYIVSKGSIAVNGVSLTIATCNSVGSWFKVAVIPLTYGETNLRYLQPGSPVNLEGDVLGKYVEKFLCMGQPAAEPLASLQAMSGVTDGFLAEHGYL
ncbi:MAG: riboflavin synthase [Leptolyngbyaceae cyanobacterium CSU_1_4]|nr:riboflavin synthase [Leptolyngbyaceae cyanobacterium CSU_1_4]